MKFLLKKGYIMKKAINKLLFILILMNFSTISLAMTERRDMPFQPLEHEKIEREETSHKISYIHHEPPFQHVVEYNKDTGEYSGYSHHIKFGRTKRIENPAQKYQIYATSYQNND